MAGVDGEIVFVSAQHEAFKSVKMRTAATVFIGLLFSGIMLLHSPVVRRSAPNSLRMIIDNKRL